MSHHEAHCRCSTCGWTFTVHQVPTDEVYSGAVGFEEVIAP
jgi:rubredoxin